MHFKWFMTIQNAAGKGADMASIQSRIANLEQSTREATCRQLSDAERAVWLVHILNDPARSAEHAPLRALLKRLMGRDVLL